MITKTQFVSTVAVVASCLSLGTIACSSDAGGPAESTEGAPSASSGLTRKLWVLNQNGDPAVAEFFQCVLGQTNWNDLANTYRYGESLTWGGQAVRNDNPCTGSVGTDGFYQCAVNAGRFNVSPWDVVLVIIPSSGYGGQNGTAAVRNPITGASVTINSAYVRSSPGGLKYQTIYGGHEVFEAQTDGVSADCCDGETSSGGPFPWCPECGPYNGGTGVCGKYATGGTVGTLGIDTISCNGRTFFYQRVSPANHEFDGTCSAITVKGGGGSSDPCANVSGANNGEYCGASREGGFGGGNANTLYNCQNGKTASTSSCANGCYVAPAGQSDGCVTDPCAGVSAANNGVYCGTSSQNGFAHGAPNVLYTCRSGQVASKQTCPKGCHVAPAGQADACN